MNKEATRQVPVGMVKNLATRWELSGPGIEDSNTQNIRTSSGGRDMKQRRNAPQLHTKFLQEILSGASNNRYSELEVVSFTLEHDRVEAPTQTSYLTAIKVLTTANHDVSLIIKTINSSSPKAKVFNFKEMFKKEAFMYSTVIPLLVSVRQEEPLNIFPASYHNSNEVIVLEDLASSYGFRTGNHETGLDSAHCKLVLAELGRFHAAAYVLKNSDSADIVTALNEASRELQYTKERTTVYEENFAQLARDTVHIIRTTPSTSRYTKQVEGILNNVYHHLLKFLERQDFFTTLTHGDLWTKNIMFQYSRDKPVAVKFLDFQTCRYGSPALDINYFLYTSTTAEVRERYMDEFMRSYHRSLARTLRLSGVNCTVSLMDLRREVDSMSLYGFLSAHLMLRDTVEYDATPANVPDELFSRRIVETVLELGEQGIF